MIDAVAEAIRAEEDLEIYTSGTNNIFRYPELADQQKASELISLADNDRQNLAGIHPGELNEFQLAPLCLGRSRLAAEPFPSIPI